MTGRFTLGALVALTLCIPTSVRAQGGAASYNPGTPQPFVNATPAGWTPAMAQPGSGPYCGYSIPYAGGPYAVPGDYCPPGQNPNITHEYLPQDKGWDYEDTPVDTFLKNAFANTYMRFEYLSWNIEEPGNSLLGSPVLGVDNPRQPFTVLDPVTSLPTAVAIVPFLNPYELKNNNGIRGTVGVPLTFAAFEASFFGLAQSAYNGRQENIFETGVLIGTSTLTNGALGTNIFLYDESFEADYESQTWGAQANIIFDSQWPHPGLQFRPIAGIRYVSFDENLHQTGVYNANDTLPDLVSVIDADVKNNIYGPQLGFRSELVNKWFTIGVEPKIMLGVNDYTAVVQTSQLRSAADPDTYSEVGRVDFGAVFELGVYARAHVNNYLSLHVGYDLLWLGHVTRPGDDIYYNDNGAANPPAITARSEFSDLKLQGISVGGEIRFK